MLTATVKRWNPVTVVAACVVRRERCDRAVAGASGVTVSTTPASRRRAGPPPSPALLTGGGGADQPVSVRVWW